jgi:hypothetical protein
VLLSRPKHSDFEEKNALFVVRQGVIVREVNGRDSLYEGGWLPGPGDITRMTGGRRVVAGR